MATPRTAKSCAQLDAEAKATRSAADTSKDATTRELCLKAASTLESLARGEGRKLAKLAEPVRILPDNASVTEVRQARYRQAVRCGEDVFLPTGKEMTVGIPNLFLRSALFAAAEVSDKHLHDQKIASQGDNSITLTGHPLGNYDRRVFAACLTYYRGDRPLCGEGEPNWVSVTFWQLSRDLNVSYCANTHRAIRDSLVRINAANLRVRVNRLDIPVPRLIDVVLNDGYQGSDTPAQRLRGSDQVSFRVLDSMALLFGPAAWSAVASADMHAYSGLPAWLVGFYSTHAKPYPVKIEDLFRWSGVVCDLREFRRRLKNALSRLQKDDVSEGVRVSAYELSSAHLTVYLLRWQPAQVARVATGT